MSPAPSFLEGATYKANCPKTDASSRNGKEGHKPLSVGVAPRMKVIRAGYRLGDICLLIVIYLLGGWLSYRVIGWLTKPRPDKDGR